MAPTATTVFDVWCPAFNDFMNCALRRSDSFFWILQIWQIPINALQHFVENHDLKLADRRYFQINRGLLLQVRHDVKQPVGQQGKRGCFHHHQQQIFITMAKLKDFGSFDRALRATQFNGINLCRVKTEHLNFPRISDPIPYQPIFFELRKSKRQVWRMGFPCICVMPFLVPDETISRRHPFP